MTRRSAGARRAGGGLPRGGVAGAGRGALEGGGRGARGARPPLRPPFRPAPLPPRGSCLDRGRCRLLVFPEGSAAVSAARRVTWERGAQAEKDERGPGVGPAARVPVRRRDAPLPGLGAGFPACRAAGILHRDGALGGGAGPGAGSWMQRPDRKLLALPEEFTRRGASLGREGRALGRPAGRGVASGGPLASGGPARPPSERLQVCAFPCFPRAQSASG